MTRADPTSPPAAVHTPHRLPRHDQADRADLQPRLQILLLPRKGKALSRSAEMADAAMRCWRPTSASTSRAQQVPEINFAWQGGEPTLLGVDFFRKVVALQRNYANGKQHPQRPPDQRHASRRRMVRVPRRTTFPRRPEHRRPARLHDAYRVDKQQQPDLRRVMRRPRRLKKHKVDFNTLTVVNRLTAKSRWTSTASSSRSAPASSSSSRSSSVCPQTRLTVLGLDLAEPPVPGGGHDEFPRHRLERATQRPRGILRARSSTNGSGATSAKSSCSSSTSRWATGWAWAPVSASSPRSAARRWRSNTTATSTPATTTSTRATSSATSSTTRWARWSARAEQRKFGNDKSDTLPQYCRDCEVRFACNGECPKHRFIRTPDGEEGLNYLCPALQAILQPHRPVHEDHGQPPRQAPPAADIMGLLARSPQTSPPPRVPSAATTPAPAAAAKNTRSAAAAIRLKCDSHLPALKNNRTDLPHLDTMPYSMPSPGITHDLPEVISLLQDISRHQDPMSMLSAYAAHRNQTFPIDRSVSLSRRDLQPPAYRITRSDLWPQEINPWKQKNRLPAFSGGLLGKLLYDGRAVILDHINFSADDPAAEYFADMKSLAAIPHFDDGVVVNMVVHMRKEESAFDPRQFPQMVLLSGMFGRAMKGLVLAAGLSAAKEELQNMYHTMTDLPTPCSIRPGHSSTRTRRSRSVSASAPPNLKPAPTNWKTPTTTRFTSSPSPAK